MTTKTVRWMIDRIADLEETVETVRPLFDKHGPVTGSREWQQAWEKADLALMATSKPLLTVKQLRDLWN